MNKKRVRKPITPEQRDAKNKQSLEYYYANRKRILADRKARGSNSRWYQANKETAIKSAADWRAANKEKLKQINKNAWEQFKGSVDYRVSLGKKRDKSAKARKERELAEYKSKPVWNPGDNSNARQKKARS